MTNMKQFNEQALCDMVLCVYSIICCIHVSLCNDNVICCYKAWQGHTSAYSKGHFTVELQIHVHILDTAMCGRVCPVVM